MTKVDIEKKRIINKIEHFAKESIKNGKNLIIIGGFGTGKSFLLKNLLSFIKDDLQQEICYYDFLNETETMRFKELRLSNLKKSF